MLSRSRGTPQWCKALIKTPTWTLSSSPATGRTFQPGPIQAAHSAHTPVPRPAGQPSKPSHAGPGCGRLWAGRARCHNRARRVHRAERPARVRALGPAACRAAAASSGRGTIWSYGANADQTLIRKTGRPRPAFDEEITALRLDHFIKSGINWYYNKDLRNH